MAIITKTTKKNEEARKFRVPDKVIRIMKTGRIAFDK